VIDADMQHDETKLPAMLRRLTTTDADVVDDSRHVAGGGLGDWSETRARMSALATWRAKSEVGTALSDPISAVFAIKRDVFLLCVHGLSQQGSKILLGRLTSAPYTVKALEVPYVFRSRLRCEQGRCHGAGRVSLSADREAHQRADTSQVVLFSTVGLIGLLLHVAVLQTLKTAGAAFLTSQITATVAAMTLSYVINNAITYRSQRLKGARFVMGYVKFCLICAVGGVANIGVADLVLTGYDGWLVAGLAGAFVSALFNFGVATRFVWKQRGPRRRPAVRRVTTRLSPPNALGACSGCVSRSDRERRVRSDRFARTFRHAETRRRHSRERHW